MKYFLACLFIPSALILLIAVFGIGALYIGVSNLATRKPSATEFPPKLAVLPVTEFCSEL